MDELSAVGNEDERQEVESDDIIPILDVSSSIPNRAKKIQVGQLVDKMVGDNFADIELSNITNQDEARDNLGLGDLAIEDQVSSAIKDNDAANVNARLGEFSTIADVQNSHIPAVLESIRTFGRNAPGDGPPLDLVRGSEVPGAIQSADGQWWEDLGYASIVVRIPSDFPTLQEAVDHWNRLPLRAGARIELRIESGHALTSGLVVEHGDYSHFIITSDDTEVPLVSNFGGTIISGDNASMPTLACLIDASNQSSGNGLTVYRASRIHVEEGCGIKNAYATALLARYGSSVSANGTVWTGAARNGNTGAGITAWGAYIDARLADVSNSSYYGAQAAHAGLLNFMHGNANDCGRHGIRATDAAVVDATGAQANRCGTEAGGYNVYSYEGGFINFSGGSANDCGGADNLMAFGASTINARGATATGASRYGAHADQGSTINLIDATVSGNSGDVVNKGGLTPHSPEEPRRGPWATHQEVVISSNGTAYYIPNPTGVNFIELDTNGGASQDDLDYLRPVGEYDAVSGDIVILGIRSSARTVTIRNRNQIGAGIHGFTAPQVELTSGTRTVAYVRKGSFWFRLNTPD